MTKNALPTISIKGKDYVLVKDRIAFFNEAFENGSIRTELVSYEGGQAVVKATVIPDTKAPERYFTGYSQAKESDGMVNKTAALENAESSAVGRALAMMGIGVIESIASADEMAKATAANTHMGKQALAALQKAPVTSPDTREDYPEPRGEEVAMKASLDESLAGATSEDDRPAFLKDYKCAKCGEPAEFYEGISKKTGLPYKALFCSTEDKNHTEFL